jgi:hypothetical protein
VHLLEPLADQAEGFAEPPLEGAVQLLVDRVAHLLEPAFVRRLEPGDALVERGAQAGELVEVGPRQLAERLEEPGIDRLEAAAHLLLKVLEEEMLAFDQRREALVERLAARGRALLDPRGNLFAQLPGLAVETIGGAGIRVLAAQREAELHQLQQQDQDGQHDQSRNHGANFNPRLLLA